MKESTYTTPAIEIDTRITKLQRVLQDKCVDGALIAEKTDLFYFSGTAQQGWLYVPASGEPILMVSKDYDRACRDSPLVKIISLLSPKKIPECLADFGLVDVAQIGMELDVLPVNLYFQYQKIFTRSEIIDFSTEIRLMRAVKSSYEIEKIRQAARCSDLVAVKVEELLVPGKTEVTLAGELEGYARSLGHQGIVRMRMWGGELFYGHLMSGTSAAVPSYLASPTGGEGVSSIIGQGAGYKIIGKDEPVLVDLVFALDGYLSDHARIFVAGHLPDKLMAAHEAMLDIQETIKNIAKPRAITGELYETMTDLAEKKGYINEFMGGRGEADTFHRTRSGAGTGRISFHCERSEACT